MTTPRGPYRRRRRGLFPLLAAGIVVVLGIGVLVVAYVKVRDAVPAAAQDQTSSPAVPAPAGSTAPPVDNGAQFTLSAVGDVILGAAPNGLPPTTVTASSTTWTSICTPICRWPTWRSR